MLYHVFENKFKCGLQTKKYYGVCLYVYCVYILLPRLNCDTYSTQDACFLGEGGVVYTPRVLYSSTEIKF